MTNLMRDFKLMATALTKRIKQILVIAPVALLAACATEGTTIYGNVTPGVVAYTPPDAAVGPTRFEGTNDGRPGWSAQNCLVGGGSLKTYKIDLATVTMSVENRTSPYGWHVHAEGLQYTTGKPFSADISERGSVPYLGSLTNGANIYNVTLADRPVTDLQNWTFLAPLARQAVRDQYGNMDCNKPYQPYRVLRPATQQIYSARPSSSFTYGD